MLIYFIHFSYYALYQFNLILTTYICKLSVSDKDSGVLAISNSLLEPVTTLEPRGRLLLLHYLGVLGVAQWLLHKYVNVGTIPF